MNLYLFPEHVRAGAARALAQDQDSPLLQRLVALINTRIQQIEDVLWQLHEGGALALAKGFELDRIGAIVGEARNGRADDLYRLWITARAAVNRSVGTPNELLHILRLVMPADSSISYTDVEPRDAEAYFEVSNSGGISLVEVRKILTEAVSAGVLLHLVQSIDPATAFCFEGGPGLGFDAGRFSDVV